MCFFAIYFSPSNIFASTSHCYPWDSHWLVTGRVVKALGHFRMLIRHGGNWSLHTRLPASVCKSFAVRSTFRAISPWLHSEWHTAVIFWHGWNAENHSAIGSERKVNLPEQFAETDHAIQPMQCWLWCHQSQQWRDTCYELTPSNSRLWCWCLQVFPLSLPPLPHLSMHSPNASLAFSQPYEKHNH